MKRDIKRLYLNEDSEKKSLKNELITLLKVIITAIAILTLLMNVGCASIKIEKDPFYGSDTITENKIGCFQVK